MAKWTTVPPQSHPIPPCRQRGSAEMCSMSCWHCQRCFTPTDDVAKTWRHISVASMLASDYFITPSHQRDQKHKIMCRYPETPPSSLQPPSNSPPPKMNTVYPNAICATGSQGKTIKTLWECTSWWRWQWPGAYLHPISTVPTPIRSPWTPWGVFKVLAAW